MGVTTADVRALVTAAGDTLHATAAGVLARLPKGTDGQVLTLASGLPSWAAGGGSAEDPLAILDVIEDFISGTSATAGSIGSTGWGDSGGAAPTNLDGVANHPGIIQKGTSATQDTVAALFSKNSTTAVVLLPDGTFDLTFVLRPSTDIVDTTIRVGLASTAVGNPAANGIYASTLSTDGTRQWFGVTRAAAAETRTSLGATLAASGVWVKIRLRRIDASTIGITLNALTEVTFTATIPTVALLPFVQIINVGVASNKTYDLDFVRVRVTGMTR